MDNIDLSAYKANKSGIINKNSKNFLIEKERNSQNKIKRHKDEKIYEKNNSHFINAILYSSAKYQNKNKSEKYKVNSNLIKFYNDISQNKNSKFSLDIQKRHNFEVIAKFKKLYFQPEEEKSKDYNQNNPILNLNINNFNNMPSFTKELRKCLYSNSDIQSSKGSQSNSYNHSSNSGSHSFNQKNNNESSQILEKISEISEEHMHEDNQTLLQVISEKRNNNENNYIEENKNKINCKICKEEKDKYNNKKTENNHFNNDLLVMISTTKEEVEKIQSKVKKKIIIMIHYFQ